MAFFICTALFFAATLLCLFLGYPLLYALILGFFLFITAGLINGYSLKQLLIMSWHGSKRSLIVLRILVIIGIITGLWRSSGTIASFISLGIRAITPQWFLLTVFLLCSLMAYALGTSFGVAGTLGVIFMAIARSSGVNTTVTAGVVLAAEYVGDRAAPSSSCANLVAAVTDTDINTNVKLMFNTGLIPYIITLAIYAFLSTRHPLQNVDISITQSISSAFDISLWTLIPAAIMLILPLFNLPIIWCMLLSVISAATISIALQGTGIVELLRIAVLGFESPDPLIGHVFGGGGIRSMLQPICMVTLAGTFAGIFEGTHTLDKLRGGAERLSDKLGLFPSLSLYGIAMCMLFCNQTIAIIMSSQLWSPIYDKSGASRQELSIDIANSVSVLASIVPWCVACSGPLGTLGEGFGALAYAYFPVILPIYWIFAKKHRFPHHPKVETMPKPETPEAG